MIAQPPLPLPAEPYEHIYNCYGQELISLCQRAHAERRIITRLEAKGRHYKVFIARRPLRFTSVS